MERTPSPLLPALLVSVLAGAGLAGPHSARPAEQERARGRSEASDWPRWRGPDRTGVSRETGWASEGLAESVWTKTVGRGHSCSSIRDGRLFTLGFDEALGVDTLFCLDAGTGEELWTFSYPAQLDDVGHGGGTLTTPAVEGGKVWVTNRKGTLRCLRADAASSRGLGTWRGTSTRSRRTTASAARRSCWRT